MPRMEPLRVTLKRGRTGRGPGGYSPLAIFKKKLRTEAPIEF
jgi:hypothetical protein